MKLRNAAVLALAALALAGCKKKQPPTTPAARPEATTPATSGPSAEELEREASRRRAAARADSVRVETERVRESLREIVYFEFDSFELTPEAQARLQRKAEVLRAHPGLRLRIEGHADQRGSTEYNLALGQQRAEVVRNFLAEYGIPANRLETTSHGEERPLAEGEGEEFWARNRRAEFDVAGGEISWPPARGR